MIITVTLNPALDCYFAPEQLKAGGVNRYDDYRFLPGGKGVNVSLMLSALGMETVAMGFGAGFTGKELVRLIEQEGCSADFTILPQGSTRMNIKIRTAEGEETDLNGAGVPLPLEAVEELGQKLLTLKPGDGLVLAGSLPPGLPQDTYAKFLEALREKEILTVVDTAGGALEAALPCHPFLIKPNLEELGELFGVEITELDAAAECANELQKRGARNVAVSMGHKGALLLCEDGRRLFCHAVRGEAVSTVGAGDSFVAGFLYGLQLHGTMDGALRWAVCAGSATAFSPGLASGSEVRQLYTRVGNVHMI
ncbi:MAG: 1-phosphofructokinase [Acutalibacter sp.]|nr:1-phosphofructokinase [Acutalibacter sp.]